MSGRRNDRRGDRGEYPRGSAGQGERSTAGDREQLEYDRLMSRYVFDEETGMVFEITESRPLPIAQYMSAALCALLVMIAVSAWLFGGAPLIPETIAPEPGQSVLDEFLHPESGEELPPEAEDAPQQPGGTTGDEPEPVVYIPASIVVEGDVVATLASAEAAYSLLEEVKNHFDTMVEGEGERVTEYREEPSVIPEPDAAQTESFDDVFARFTSRRSPVEVMTTVTTTETEMTAFDTEEEEDDELMEGTRMIVSQGRTGRETTITRDVYINGDRSSSRSGREKQEIEPQDRIILVGAQEYDDGEPGRHEGHDGRETDIEFTDPVEGEIQLNFGQVEGVMHLGLDYGEIEEGAPVVASAAGTVVCAMERGGYGLMIEIDHGDGFVTRYARLGGIDVALGDTVAQGQPIGRPGLDGDELTLHFEMRIDAVAYNPRQYL